MDRTLFAFAWKATASIRAPFRAWIRSTISVGCRNCAWLRISILKPFSPEVMDGCHKAAGELYAELNQKNPAFKKLYDSYKAFMDDGYLWHQVADYTMDSYMIRYRNQKT